MILWPPVAVFVLPSLCLTNKKSVSDERPVFHRPGKHAKFLKAIVNKTKKNQTNKVSHPTPPETASSTSAAGTTPPPNPGAAAAAGPKKRKGLYGSFSEGLETYRRDVGAIRSMLTQIPDDPRAIDGGDCAMHRMFFKSIAKQAERCAAFCNALVQIVRVQAAFRGRRVRRSFCISSSPQSQSQSQPQAHPTVVPRMMKLWKSAELRARNDALRDLMKVEITFRRKVSALRDGFAAPLRQSLETKAPLLTGQEIAAIFSPLDAVAAIDDTIYKKLDEVYSTHWPFVCNVGEVFTSVAPQLSAYGQYSKNVPIAVQTVIMLSQTNPRFATFLAQVELEGDLEGARLIDLLPAPLQQISKYEISMQSLMEATAKLAHNNAFSHLIPPTELESLATATTLLQRVNMVLYVSYEMSSNRSMVVSILKNLANSKALEGESSRRFISEGDCTIVSKSHLLHKESKRHFFLFNDVLALAKRNRISYNAKELLWLKTVKLEPVPPTDGGATSIMLVSPQRSILMILSTPSQAAEMETQISFLIQSSVSPALVFGGDLSELVIRDSSNGVPSVLQILANLLLPHLGTEGIFREAGNKQKIEELQRAFNESKWEGVDIIGEYGIHSVASARPEKNQHYIFIY
ncbi:hypothetical protein Pelo_10697 [Pelomyxa schiedti]|nr:hypothetical protein Pelo_10697 [Pelomyxa schiedti]